jgi:uncharacterized protein YukE
VPGPVWLPEVVGDPAGMRALASALRRSAEQISHVDSDISAAVSAMTCEGPAGDRFRTAATTTGGRATSAAERLQSLAGTLERSAAEVEQAQAERLRRLEEMRRELEAARAQRAAATP